MLAATEEKNPSSARKSPPAFKPTESKSHLEIINSIENSNYVLALNESNNGLYLLINLLSEQHSTFN